jgi:hypothetical protein
MAYQTLNLIAARDDLTLEELSYLLAVDLEKGSFDRQNRPLDLYAPIEACTCLLTLPCNTDTRDLHLAHYTVKEYLNSSRVCKGPAKMYQMTDDSMYSMLASCLITYMLYESYEVEHKPLMLCAITEWHEVFEDIDSISARKSLSGLIIQLLDPNEPHYLNWRNEVAKALVLAPTDSPYPFWSAEPGAEPCATLASLCWFGCIEAAQLFLDTQKSPFPFQKPIYWTIPADFPRRFHDSQVLYSRFGHELSKDKRSKENLLLYLKNEFSGLEALTVVHVALLRSDDFQPGFLGLMLSKGADINVRSLTGSSLLNTVLNGRTRLRECVSAWGDDTNPFDFLLANGAQVNPNQCTITPLQSAIARARRSLYPLSEPMARWYKFSDHYVLLDNLFHVARKLLECGAMVNGVCHDEANISRIRQICHIYLQQPEESSPTSDETEYINAALEARGLTALYDTPLRMLDQIGDHIGVTQSTKPPPKNVLQAFYGIRKLLLSYGAKSLHLFPVEDLPGYVKEDMEEWKKIEDCQMASPSSTSILGHQIESQE